MGTLRIAFLRYAAAFLLLSLASHASAANGRLFGISSDSGDNNVLIEIDPATGAANAVGPIGIDGLVGLSFNPATRRLLGYSLFTNELVDINPNTGEGLAIATLTSSPLGGAGISALAFDPTGETLFSSDNGELIEIDPATGVADFIGSVIIDDNPIFSVNGLAFAPSSGTLFGLDGFNLIAIDPATGVGTSLSSTNIGFLEGLAFDPTNSVLFSLDTANDTLLTIDTASASVASTIPLGAENIFDLAFIPVPEPSAAMLAIASLSLIPAGSRTRSREV